MESFLRLYLLSILIAVGTGFLHLSKKTNKTGGENLVLANVKIYSNLAEIILPLGLLPLEFSADDWSDIRSDSVTLVGTNVNVTQQTITEKKKSLNNAQVYVRSPSSSNTETKFIKATLIDEKRNLVKLIDKDISKDPIFLTVSSDQIVYENDPPQSKYYVNFTYDTTDAVYVSYLRSNLNWKTRYQLNLFDDSKNSVLISMADIRNDGQSKVDIEHAELLGGDINLQMYGQPYIVQESVTYERYAYSVAGPPGAPSSPSPRPPSVGQGEEVVGLYMHPINQPFSIEAKTNYLLPMFRPRVTVERYGSISKYFYGGAGSSTGKAQRSYRLSSDRFLSRGNCIIRESDRLVGETSLPDLAAKDKYEFSIGQDADIVFKENVTLVSTRTYNETIRRGSKDMQERTETVYNVNVLFKNFKKNRSVQVEYQQQISGQSVKLIKLNSNCTQDGSAIKTELTLGAGDEKTVSYKFELIN
jgi:hypothetical protein